MKNAAICSKSQKRHGRDEGGTLGMVLFGVGEIPFQNPKYTAGSNRSGVGGHIGHGYVGVGEIPFQNPRYTPDRN